MSERYPRDDDLPDLDDLPEVREPPPPPRFSGAIDLDGGVGDDDPARALWAALAVGDAERAMGAYRLMEAAGRSLDLEPTLALELADLLERHERYLDAARMCRAAAEADLNGPEAPAATLRGAKLLLGPARNHEAGLAMLRFYLERYPGHRLHDQARELLARIEAGEAPLEAGPMATGVVAHNLPAEARGPEQLQPARVHGSGLARAVQSVTGPVGSPGYRRLALVFKILLAAVVLTYGISRILSGHMGGVDQIHQALDLAPKQTEVADKRPFQVVRDGYSYQLTPLFDYEIAGLIVSLNDDTFMSVRKMDSAFPMDLCVIWGSNAHRKIHQQSSLEWSHNNRVCEFRYQGQNPVVGVEMSNTHVLMANEADDDLLFSLARGDQIRMKGQLVDVRAQLIEAGGTYDHPRFKLKTSTVRTDTGLGACEVMYVREFEVLRRANPAARKLNQLSAWVLMALLGLAALRLIVLPVRIRETR